MKPPSIHLEDDPEKVIQFYSDMVYRLAFARTGTKSDADEVYQEVFLRYIKKQPILHEEEHRKAWLIRVTINCSNSLWRSIGKRKTEPLEEPIHMQEKEEVDLRDELRKLPKKYREVVHLFYYEDMSLHEISLVLNRKNSTVRTQLTRARAMLKSLIEEDGNE